VQEFYSKLLSSIQENLGHTPTNIFEAEANGEALRFGKNNNCWLFLSEWDFKGEKYYRAAFGDWSNFEKKYEIKSWSDSKKTSKAFDEKYKEAVGRQRDLERKKRLQKNAEMLDLYMPQWETAESVIHPYHTKKKIDVFNTKVSRNTLMVPMFDGDNFIKGFQLIYKDKTGAIKKIFPKGTIKKGLMCHLKDYWEASHIYVSEGFATGASVQNIVSDPVIAAFDAGNLMAVCEEITRVNKLCAITILADNDDAGLKKAKEVCDKHKHVKYIKPAPRGKDFNDIFVEHGLDALKTYFEKTENTPLMKCLGYEGKNYAFHSKENNKVVWLTSDQMKPPHIYRIVASKEYWESRYPGKTGVDIAEMQADLHRLNHAVGNFDVSKIRGFGVWKDQDKYVVNTGEKVYNKPLNSKYHYETDSGQKIKYGIEGNHNLDDVIEFFKGINSESKNDYVFLSAFYIQAMIFGVLNFRFFLWISGRSGAGKSTLLEWYDKILPHADNNLDSTPAGIVQFAKSNQLPIIYDEIEPENRTSVEQILDLARANSSFKDRNMTKRGSPSGNVKIFNSTLLFLLGSIQQPDLKESDRNRIILIELKEASNQSEKQFDRLCELSDLIADNFHQNWNYVYSKIDLVKKVKRYALRYFKLSGKNSRQADILSTVIGCFYLTAADSYCETTIKRIIQQADFDKSSYIEDNQENQADDAVAALLDMIVTEGDKMTVGAILSGLERQTIRPEDSEYHRQLGAYGLAYKGGGELFVSNKNSNRQKKIPAYPSLTKILKREPRLKAKDAREILVNGAYPRGVTIKLPSQTEIGQPQAK
jgi:putative DNA primase/helicase